MAADPLTAGAGAPDGFSPGELRVFTNRDDLDFATVADLPPTQSWELAENLDGRIELPTQARSAHTRWCHHGSRFHGCERVPHGTKVVSQKSHVCCQTCDTTCELM